MKRAKEEAARTGKKLEEVRFEPTFSPSLPPSLLPLCFSSPACLFSPSRRCRRHLASPSLEAGKRRSSKDGEEDGGGMYTCVRVIPPSLPPSFPPSCPPSILTLRVSFPPPLPPSRWQKKGGGTDHGRPPLFLLLLFLLSPIPTLAPSLPPSLPPGGKRKVGLAGGTD